MERIWVTVSGMAWRAAAEYVYVGGGQWVPWHEAEDAYLFDARDLERALEGRFYKDDRGYQVIIAANDLEASVVMQGNADAVVFRRHIYRRDGAMWRDFRGVLAVEVGLAGYDRERDLILEGEDYLYFENPDYIVGDAQIVATWEEIYALAKERGFTTIGIARGHEDQIAELWADQHVDAVVAAGRLWVRSAGGRVAGNLEIRQSERGWTIARNGKLESAAGSFRAIIANIETR